MSKPLYLLCFADAFQNLPFLKSELEKARHLLKNRKDLKDDYDFEVVTTRETLVDLLKIETNRERLYWFYYGGHSAGDRLITEGEDASSVGISKFLAQCPNLKLVFLNGCSTKAWIPELQTAFSQSKFRMPIIIATASNIADKMAFEFAVTFVEQLIVYSKTIHDAFKTAQNAIQTHVGSERLRFLEAATEQLLDKDAWDIYIKASPEQIEQHFSQLLITTNNEYYIPNARLFRTLIRGLAAYNTEIRSRLTKDRDTIPNVNPYKSEIFKTFPYSISKRLQRLDSSESIADKEGQTGFFYNKADKHRLGELIRTSQTIVDILFAIAQAELYRLLLIDNQSFDKQCLSILHDEYYCSTSLSCIASFEKCLHALEIHKEQLYVPEIVHFWDKNTANFFEIGKFFEHLAAHKLSDDEANNLVELAEIRLSIMFTYITFLAKYHLTSVEMIYLNRKRLTSPQYDHILYKQQWSGLEPNKDHEILEKTFLDNASIILHKDEIQHIKSYLNLTPFLIDNTLFIEKATVSDLLVFNKFKDTPETKLQYRHLIMGALSIPKELVYQVNTQGNTQIEYENIAYLEISNEWKQYLELLKNCCS